jgi:hypothetical protein
LVLPKAENGLVAETLSLAAVLLWQRHPLVAGLLFSNLGAVGIKLWYILPNNERQ